MHPIIEGEKHPTIYAGIPKYPGMTRDMALLIDESITNQQLTELIYEKGGKYLRQVRLFDLYQGEKISEGKKSLAYTLSYLNPKDTLIAEEVTKAFEKVTQALVEQFDAVVR